MALSELTHISQSVFTPLNMTSEKKESVCERSPRTGGVIEPVGLLKSCKFLGWTNVIGFV